MFKSLFLKIKFYLRGKLDLKHISKIKISSIQSQAQLANPNSPVVLLYVERYWAIHAAWELMIGKILSESGYSVIVVGCDSLNDFCDSYSYGDSISSHCNNCSLSLKRITLKFGLSYISMNEYLSENVESLSQSIFFNDIKSQYDEIIHCSFIRHLRSTVLEEKDNWIRKKLIESANRVNLFWDHYLTNNKCDICFFLNGAFSNSFVLRKHCEHRQINYVTYERGNRKDTLVISKNSQAVPITMEDLWNSSIGYELSSADSIKLERYLNSRLQVGNGHVSFFPKKMEKKNIIFQNLIDDTNKFQKSFILFSNLIWDSAVLNQDTIFESMYHWVKETVNYFQLNINYRLIIRIHPAEQRIEWWKTRYGVSSFINDNFNNLSKNIFIIGPESSIDSYELMKISDVGLFYSSTAGLEFGLLNKPVILCAKSHYSFLNFLHTPKSVGDYFRMLAHDLTVRPNQVHELKKYCYLFYFVRNIEFPIITETKSFEVNITSTSEIDETLRKKITSYFEF